jgi:hypothetical protein
MRDAGIGRGGRCCGRRHRREDVALSPAQEIGLLQRQIGDFQVRLEALRRG